MVYGYTTRNVCTEAIFVDDEYVEFDHEDLKTLMHYSTAKDDIN